jgi:hypothetical protein
MAWDKKEFPVGCKVRFREGSQWKDRYKLGIIDPDLTKTRQNDGGTYYEGGEFVPVRVLELTEEWAAKKEVNKALAHGGFFRHDLIRIDEDIVHTDQEPASAENVIEI